VPISFIDSARVIEGIDLGVNGTPNTFIVKNENGKYTILESISGALPKETIESAIAKYSN
jgi:protein-disulfide isomerase